jgi:hypothetical protein
MLKSRLILPALFLLCVVCDVCVARTIYPSADMVQNYNELLSVRAGNVLLDHWALGIDNFYFTDLPMFAVLGWVFGQQPWLIYAVPSVVFALLLLAGILLIRRVRPAGDAGWAGPALFLLLAGMPFLHGQSAFILTPAIHIGTIMFCLYAVLIIEPALSGRPISWALWLAFFLICAAAVASDPMAMILLSAPLLLLVILRLWLHPGFRPGDWRAAGVVFAASMPGAAFSSIMAHNHGFSTHVNLLTGLVSDAAGIEANCKAQAAALRILFGAQGASPQWFGARLFAFTRMLTALTVLSLCARLIWRMPRAIDEPVPQLLLLGALAMSAADTFGMAFTAATQGGAGYPVAAIRYEVPVFLFLSIAGAIEAQNYLPRAKWRKGIMRITLVFATVFALIAAPAVLRAAAKPAGFATAPQAAVANWLKARGLRYGIGDYWTAGLIFCLSGNAVIADAVNGPDGLAPFPFNNDFSRFIARKTPQFVVFSTGNSSGVTLAEAQRSYGKPHEIDQVAGYTMLILASPAGAQRPARK